MKNLNVLPAIQSFLKYMVMYTRICTYFSNELITKELHNSFFYKLPRQKRSGLSVTKICTLEVYCFFSDEESVYLFSSNHLQSCEKSFLICFGLLMISVLPRRSINH